MKELYSVLIVDDESILRNGLKHICDWEEEGFQLIGEAANGKEALEIIKDKEPNIVITDLIMPEIDGVELTKIIKKDYPNTKVLVLSNVSEFEYVKDTFKYGIHDYLLKTEASAESIVPILKNMIDEIHYIDNKNKRIDKTEKLENDLTSLILYRRIDDNDLASLEEYFYMNNFYVMMTEMYQLDEEYVDLKEIHCEIKNKFNNVMNENPYIVLLIKNKLI
ncbi:response regulator, partial [Clostridium tertium]